MSAPAAVVDRNDLAYWYPRIAARVPAPLTHIVRAQRGLEALLDQEEPPGFDALVVSLCRAGDVLGWPCFLRTGHGSGKHDWRNTCYVPDAGAMAGHVSALVEWSHLVDMWGLPHETWAVRQMVPTETLFVCEAYGGFPVTREFRFFVERGRVTHWQPYWPPDACERGRPDRPQWRERLARASRPAGAWGVLTTLALEAGRAAGQADHWSVDLLEDIRGRWWVTDMAEADRSFRWDA